jgi:hypothetical protein
MPVPRSKFDFCVLFKPCTSAVARSLEEGPHGLPAKAVPARATTPTARRSIFLDMQLKAALQYTAFGVPIAIDGFGWPPTDAGVVY